MRIIYEDNSKKGRELPDGRKRKRCLRLHVTVNGPESPRLSKPDFYPHLFEVACQASRYRWDCETVKDCIGLRGRFTESNCKMWVKDRTAGGRLLVALPA